MKSPTVLHAISLQVRGWEWAGAPVAPISHHAVSAPSTLAVVRVADQTQSQWCERRRIGIQTPPALDRQGLNTPLGLPKTMGVGGEFDVGYPDYDSLQYGEYHSDCSIRIVER